LLNVPPKDEQKAIAQTLGDFDELIDGLDALIQKKRDIKQAAMQQLLSGKSRLNGFAKPWEEFRFGELAYPRRDRTSPEHGELSDFCIELEDIQQGTGELIGESSTGQGSSMKTVFLPGDVLFGKLRAYLRKFWLADRPGVCSTEIWALVSNRNLILPEYLFQIVRQQKFIDAASVTYGTHMPRSDWNVVKQFMLRVPYVKEQHAIAEVLSDMDVEIAALGKRRDKTQALKLGVMNQLLSGNVRLI
jgi:type I restriction enzyme S subunit